jgi:hypothetical protein
MRASERQHQLARTYDVMQTRSSGDRESPFGSAHFKVRVFDWDLIRAEH